MMMLREAYISNAIVGIAAVFWYRSCVRAYNRFKYINTVEDWRKPQNQQRIEGDAPDVGLSDIIAGVSTSRPDSGKQSVSVSSADSHVDEALHHEGYMATLTNSTSSSSSSSSSSHSHPNANANASGSGSSSAGGSNGTGSATWLRWYYVLSDTQLWCYTSKMDFGRDPQSPVRTRAIDVEDFEPSLSLANALVVELRPRDRDTRSAWTFRCDTEAEANEWLQSFRSANAIAASRSPLHNLRR